MSSNPENYDPAWVATYFDQFGEKEWDRLTRTPADEVSLHIHAHLLRRHLRPGSRVLEIGAGPGRFTQIMAGMQCEVTVADISAGQLELNRRKATELGFAGAVREWCMLDICDLRRFGDAAFDAVVAYGGPISYVFDRADIALQECRRVLTDEGKFFCSVMSLWGTCHRYLEGVLATAPEKNRKVFDTGDLSTSTLPENGHFCRLYRAAGLRELLARNALPAIAMSAAGFLALRWENELTEVRKDGAKWSELLQMETEACAEPGCWDAGTHLIAVGAKVAARHQV